MNDQRELILMCSLFGNASGARRRSGYTNASETFHVVDQATKRTLCGRDATEWIKMEGDATDAIGNPYCCRRCESIVRDEP